jgi:rubredoxin
MATATPTMEPRASDAEHRDRTVWRCNCGHALREFGGGRHRVYFEPGAQSEDPVLNRVCPACGRPLPGKNGR